VGGGRTLEIKLEQGARQEASKKYEKGGEIHSRVLVQKGAPEARKAKNMKTFHVTVNVSASGTKPTSPEGYESSFRMMLKATEEVHDQESNIHLEIGQVIKWSGKTFIRSQKNGLNVQMKS